jgi:hypothetical protein
MDPDRAPCIAQIRLAHMLWAPTIHVKIVIAGEMGINLVEKDVGME